MGNETLDIAPVDGHPNRFTYRRPGYDCLHAPCQHEVKGEHGISGGEWRFIVRDGPVAVALQVLTSFFPKTVPRAHRDHGWPAKQDKIIGAIDFHRAIPTERDIEGQDCPFVPGGRCYGLDYGYSIVDQFVPLMAETFEQPESFWQRLEEMAAEFRREVEAEALILVAKLREVARQIEDEKP